MLRKAAAFADGLFNGAEREVSADAIERAIGLLQTYLRVDDAAGQTQACEALASACRGGGASAARSRELVLRLDVIPTVVAVLNVSHPTHACRAAAQLVAELASAGVSHEITSSGIARLLLYHLERSHDARLLVEGARTLAALAISADAVAELVRLKTPQLLCHLLRSTGVGARQAHASALLALGRCVEASPGLLESQTLLRVICTRAADSTLDARLAAAAALAHILEGPLQRPPLLRHHVVGVLLRCASCLDAELQLQALGGLILLVAAEPRRARPRGAHRGGEGDRGVSGRVDRCRVGDEQSVFVDAAEAEAARRARDGTLEEIILLKGSATLLAIVKATADADADATASVAAAKVKVEAMRLIEMLSREPAQRSELLAADGIRVLVDAIESGLSDAPLSANRLHGTTPASERPRGGGALSERNWPSPRAQPRLTRSDMGGMGGDLGGRGRGDAGLLRLFALAAGAISNLVAEIAARRSLLRARGVAALVAAFEASERCGERAGERCGERAGERAGERGGDLGRERRGENGRSRIDQRTGDRRREAEHECWFSAAESAAVLDARAAVRQETARALVALSAHGPIRGELLAQGAMAPLVVLLSAPVSSARSAAAAAARTLTIRFTAGALSFLLRVPEAHSVFAGGLGRCTDATSASQPADVFPGTMPAASAARGLSAGGGPPALNSALVAALVAIAASEDGETQRHAARALVLLSTNPRLGAAIAARGGLRPLVRVGYSMSSELQLGIVEALGALALEPSLGAMLDAEGATTLLEQLRHSRQQDVALSAQLALGNKEAAKMLGALVRHCPLEKLVVPVEIREVGALVKLLRERRGGSVSEQPTGNTTGNTTGNIPGQGNTVGQRKPPQLEGSSSRRLAATALANLVISTHNQRLLIECGGLRDLVSAASISGAASPNPTASGAADSPALRSECLRALANLAVSPSVRKELLSAKVLPVAIRTLQEPWPLADGSHGLVRLGHAARALGNLCADDSELAEAVRVRAGESGALKALLVLLSRAVELAGGATGREAAASGGGVRRAAPAQKKRDGSPQRPQVTRLLRDGPLRVANGGLLVEALRALAALASLEANHELISTAPQLHLATRMLCERGTRNSAQRVECLRLLLALARRRECRTQLVAQGVIESLLALLNGEHTSRREAVHAAELLATLAHDAPHRERICNAKPLPMLIRLLEPAVAGDADGAEEEGGRAIEGGRAPLGALRAIHAVVKAGREQCALALAAGLLIPSVRLARSVDKQTSAEAAALLMRIVIAEKEDERLRPREGRREEREASKGEASKGTRSVRIRVPEAQRLPVLVAMAMGANDQAQALAAMGLAALAREPRAGEGGAMDEPSAVATAALGGLVHLGGAASAETQCAALDALAALAERPHVQVALLHHGALKMLLERAATSGGGVHRDVRTLALETLRLMASNGDNLSRMHTQDFLTRLQGVARHHASSERVSEAVQKGVDAISSDLKTVSILRDIQGEQPEAHGKQGASKQQQPRLLRAGEVAAMRECVRCAGVDASIAREVAITCASIGSQPRANVAVFYKEGGIAMLSDLAGSRHKETLLEAAAALVAFSRVREAHKPMVASGCVTQLVRIASSNDPELRRLVGAAFSLLAEHRAPRTCLVQSGAVPHLLRLVRHVDHPETQVAAAKALMYMR